MKKIIFVLTICLGLLVPLMAQNVWRPINLDYESDYLGVCTDGTIFAYNGYYGSIIRSQDEGTTWETILDQNVGYFSTNRFTINNNNRIFAIEGMSKIVYYSDDKGNNWQQMTPVPIDIVYVHNLYSPSNSVLLGWTENEIFWTTDSGDTWGVTELDFINEPGYFGYVIANEEGDVYASVTNTEMYYNRGIYHTTLSDMHNWTYIAFDGWTIYYMTFDPDGNVVASSTGEGVAVGASQAGCYVFNTRELAVSDNGMIYKLGNGSTGSTVKLYYSKNHSFNFYEIGEEMPIMQIPVPGPADGYLFKGHDNHLYFFGNGQYYKSVRNADEIVPGIGTLARIEAPYFENNACNYRFAIINESDTCYTMVDNVWPNPNADELIVKYDTILLGTEIDVIGDYFNMEDDHGKTFQVVDIHQYNNAIYSYSTGYLLSWSTGENPQVTDVYTNSKYYVAINGELQTEYPVTFNGLTLNAGAGIYTFVGIAETWPDYDLPILNLKDIISYSTDLNINGIIRPNDLCMTLPCEEDKYLSCNDGSQEFYLTSGGKPIGKNWYNPLWNDNTNSTIAGIRGSIFDLYGNEFQTIEIRQLESVGERTLSGQIRPTSYPPTGPYPPIGLNIAIVSDEFGFFIDNPHGDGFQPYCIIENDTLPFYQDITAIISNSCMFIDGQNKKRFRVHIDDIWLNNPTSVSEIVSDGFMIYPNPTDGNITVSSTNGTEYRITNLMGQTLMTGWVNGEKHRIEVSNLHQGIYFITIGESTLKLLIK